MRRLFIFSFMLLSIIITGCSDNKQITPGDQYGYLAKSSVIIWDESSIEKVLYAAKKKDIQQLTELYDNYKVSVLNSDTMVYYHYSDTHPGMIIVTLYTNEHYNKQGFTFKDALIKK